MIKASQMGRDRQDRQQAPISRSLETEAPDQLFPGFTVAGFLGQEAVWTVTSKSSPL